MCCLCEFSNLFSNKILFFFVLNCTRQSHFGYCLSVFRWKWMTRGVRYVTWNSWISSVINHNEELMINVKEYESFILKPFRLSLQRKQNYFWWIFNWIFNICYNNYWFCYENRFIQTFCVRSYLISLFSFVWIPSFKHFYNFYTILTHIHIYVVVQF